MQAAKAFYETKKTAAKNIKLLLVRRVDALKCYCIGYNKNNNREPKYDSYYETKDLIKIFKK